MKYTAIKKGDLMVIIEGTKVCNRKGEWHTAANAYSVTASIDSSADCEWAFWRGGMAKKLNLFLRNYE